MGRRTYYADINAGRQASDTRTLAFAKNLNRELIKRNWNQSDLARAAETQMPKGRKFGRHLVSSYCRGASMPLPSQLDAICKALGVKITDLVPEGVAEILGAPTTMKITMLANNRAKIHLDTELETDLVLQIAAIVNKGSSGA